jgi:hypothetical protein
MLMLGGSLVVAGVGAGATWIHAANAAEADARALAALVGARGNCGPTCEDLRDRAARDRTQGILSLSVAGLGVLGATAYFLAYDEPAAAERSLQPVILGGAVAVAGLGAGLVFWSKANEKDQDARSQRDQLNDLGTNGCGANGPDLALCAELFENAREARKNRGFAVTGLTLAGAAVAGTAAYWAWPRSGARAGIAIGGQSRIVTLGGSF